MDGIAFILLHQSNALVFSPGCTSDFKLTLTSYIAMKKRQKRRVQSKRTRREVSKRVASCDKVSIMASAMEMNDALEDKYDDLT